LHELLAMTPQLGPIFPRDQVRTLEREELRRELGEGRPIKLVMCLPEWEFRVQHIPGSIHFRTPEQMLAGLGKDDEVVVYCTNETCLASQVVYRRLVEHGYTNVRRYAGGLTDWASAGLPLEGEANKP
jgi:rhodanese-related sulfurtransferase